MAKAAPFDVCVALVLAGFAGLIGLILGPILALALTTGAWTAHVQFEGWTTLGIACRGCLLLCSLLFSPWLAILAYRGHLQAVRDSQNQGHGRHR